MTAPPPLGGEPSLHWGGITRGWGGTQRPRHATDMACDMPLFVHRVKLVLHHCCVCTNRQRMQRAVHAFNRPSMRRGRKVGVGGGGAPALAIAMHPMLITGTSQFICGKI